VIDINQWIRDGRRRDLGKKMVTWPVLPQRFWDKVSGNSSGCWNWTGCKCRSYEAFYPRFTLGGTSFPAHKVMYLVTYGDVPEGMEIHHECRNTICVNPNHLRMVTGRENKLMSNGVSAINYRKTHCIRGHELSGDNLIQYDSPTQRKRVCRTCQKMWQERAN
jgi:hypothetical protein